MIQAYPRKQETSHRNNLRKLEKENQTKPKVRRKEILKIRVVWNGKYLGTQSPITVVYYTSRKQTTLNLNVYAFVAIYYDYLENA